MENLNILIVEDEVMTAENIRKILEKAGHRVTDIACTYQEALTAVKREWPDLVLLDIRLKGAKDGIAVANELCSCRKTPIVVLTASTENQTYLKAIETFTPAAYLSEPFRGVDLVRQVDLAWYNFHADPNIPEGSRAALIKKLRVARGRI